MKVIQSDKYENLALEWQYQMIKLLKDKLLSHKIAKDVAKEICSDFAFDLAIIQDQGEISVRKNEFRPVICFEDHDGGIHYASDEDIQMHEYAFGNTSKLFD